MDKETIFVGLLLIHGGDPEPLVDYSTDVYHAWLLRIRETLSKQELDEHIENEYIAWLASRRLAYSAELVTGE